MFLRLKSAGFTLRFFPLVIYSAILRICFLDTFIDLVSKSLANSLNFISILSSFITVFTSSILFNLFVLSILSFSVALFVVSFINSIHISIFIFIFSNLSCSSNSFQNLFFIIVVSTFLILFLFLQMPLFHQVFLIPLID